MCVCEVYNISAWAALAAVQRPILASGRGVPRLRQVTDLHRHFIDHLTLPSKEGRGRLRRVDEVFDCWFESGAMPYAQLHYPFENRDFFEANFPADFVAEGAPIPSSKRCQPGYSDVAVCLQPSCMLGMRRLSHGAACLRSTQATRGCERYARLRVKGMPKYTLETSGSHRWQS